jgi:hypothetical protein
MSEINYFKVFIIGDGYSLDYIPHNFFTFNLKLAFLLFFSAAQTELG